MTVLCFVAGLGPLLGPSVFGPFGVAKSELDDDVGVVSPKRLEVPPECVPSIPD